MHKNRCFDGLFEHSVRMATSMGTSFGVASRRATDSPGTRVVMSSLVRFSRFAAHFWPPEAEVLDRCSSMFTVCHRFPLGFRAVRLDDLLAVTRCQVVGSLSQRFSLDSTFRFMEKAEKVTEESMEKTCKASGRLRIVAQDSRR